MRAFSIERILRFNLRHRWAAAVLAVIVAAAGAYAGSSLPIRLSIIDLLPSDEPMVRELHEVSADVGGIGYLGVVIGPVDAPEKYLPDVAAALAARDDVRYAFYEREPYLLRSKALFLLPRADFDRAIAAVRVLLLGGRSGPIDLDLDSPEERAERERDARLEIDRVKREHFGPISGADPRAQRYFLSADGRSAMVFAKPTFDSAELGEAIRLVSGAKEQVSAILPAGVQFHLWGRYVNQMNDTLQVRRDIAVTSALSVAMVILILIAGLGTFRGALIAAGCVVLSMGWTAGFARLFIGQINVVTGFMLAILGGLGVEYGVHLDRRYHQEREAGRSHGEAVENTYFRVGRALLSAAVTSAGAFLVLGTSDFLGFSELGLIAGFGILSIYAVYILMFPAVSQIFSEKVRFPHAVRRFGWYPFDARWRWALPVLAVLSLWGLSRAELEINFAKMRKLSDEANRLNSFVAELMSGRSTTPAALKAPSPARAAELRDYLGAPELKPAVDAALALDNVLPLDLEDRDRQLAPLRRRIARASDDELRELLGLDPVLVREWAAQPKYSRADLPPSVADAFGASGSVVMLYTNDDLDRVPGLRRVNAVFDRVKSKYPEVKVGSDVPMLVAIVDYVFRDGQLVLILFLVAAFGVLWADFRSVSDAILLEAQLVLGIVVLVGLMGLFGQPFTIFNIAMVPAVLAAGIDMGVHLRHRELEVDGGAIEGARFVARGVQLGALTTLAGFGALFAADANILIGVAWVACLGQAAMYLVCMLAFPVAREAARARRLNPSRSPPSDHRPAASEARRTR